LANFSEFDEQTKAINTNVNPSDREAAEILRVAIILMLFNLSGFYQLVRNTEANPQIEEFTNRMAELSKGTKRVDFRSGETK